MRSSEHLFFRLSDPVVVEFLERWTKETPLQPEVFNKIQEWLGDEGKALNDWDKTKYKTPDANLDCCYTFGPIVEKNEHCNIFVYYYPKQDDVICF